VAVVAGIVGGAPAGLVVSSFTPVSLEPPLVSVCMGLGSRTWPGLRAGGRLGVSVLGAAQGAVATAMRGDRDRRFDTVDWSSPDGVAVLIPGAPLALECTVDFAVPAGDHEIVVLAVETVHASPGHDPIVFHGGAFRTLSVLF
jgi:flavin reductase (DIM6/NTAB) family NADH-FMN oxidoreductase RutF